MWVMLCAGDWDSEETGTEVSGSDDEETPQGELLANGHVGNSATEAAVQEDSAKRK